jgi:hypothetical protein
MQKSAMEKLERLKTVKCRRLHKNKILIIQNGFKDNNCHGWC